jgi:hypothetical protein
MKWEDKRKILDRPKNLRLAFESAAENPYSYQFIVQWGQKARFEKGALINASP